MKVTITPERAKEILANNANYFSGLKLPFTRNCYVDINGKIFEGNGIRLLGVSQEEESQICDLLWSYFPAGTTYQEALEEIAKGTIDAFIESYETERHLYK